MKLRIFGPLVVTLALTLFCAPAALAAFDPLGSGQTKLVLDKSFASYLKKEKLQLLAKQGAQLRGSSLLLPVSGGNFDATIGKGEIEQAGMLVFKGSRGQVPLRDVTVKAKHSPLVAKVGGSQLKVASAAKLSSVRSGFGAKFIAKPLKLTAKVAMRLNKKLRPAISFHAGQLLGTLTSTPQPKVATVLESGRATLVFDAGFLAKLESRFVSVNPIAPAERQGATFTFPIVVGGQIAPDGTEGTLRTGGEVELLQLGAGQVFWKELWLDLGAKVDSAEVDVEPTPAFPGKIGRVGVFDYATAGFASDPKARTISVAGAPLALTAAAAGTLNEAFAQGGTRPSPPGKWWEP